VVVALGDGAGSTVEVEGSDVVAEPDALADFEPTSRNEFFSGVQRIEAGVDDFGDPFEMVVEDAGEEGDEEGLDVGSPGHRRPGELGGGFGQGVEHEPNDVVLGGGSVLARRWLAAS
jgi:hypothetical protein